MKDVFPVETRIHPSVLQDEEILPLQPAMIMEFIITPAYANYLVLTTEAQSC